MSNQRFYLCIDTSAGNLKTTSFVEVIESVFYEFINDLKKGGFDVQFSDEGFIAAGLFYQRVFLSESPYYLRQKTLGYIGKPLEGGDADGS